jgi:hypothetical protein
MKMIKPDYWGGRINTNYIKKYHETRQRFGLSSQFVVRIIGKVVEAYRRDKTILPKFKELGSIQYDQRNSKVTIDRVSIMTTQEWIRYHCHYAKTS